MTDKWEPSEIYQAYRDLVKHEDLLHNERIKTLFTIQGILFVASNALWSRGPWLLLILGVFGILTAIFYSLELKKGQKAMQNILSEWNKRKYPSDPQIIGIQIPLSDEKIPINYILNSLCLIWAAFMLGAFFYGNCS